MIKRLLLLTMSLGLAVGSFSTTAYAVPKSSASITFDKYEGAEIPKDEIVTVTVGLKDVENVTDVALEINYDSSKFLFQEVLTDSAFAEKGTEESKVVDASGNIKTVTYTQKKEKDAFFTGSGNVINITFKALDKNVFVLSKEDVKLTLKNGETPIEISLTAGGMINTDGGGDTKPPTDGGGTTPPTTDGKPDGKPDYKVPETSDTSSYQYITYGLMGVVSVAILGGLGIYFFGGNRRNKLFSRHKL